MHRSDINADAPIPLHTDAGSSENPKKVMESPSQSDDSNAAEKELPTIRRSTRVRKKPDRLQY